MEEDVEIELLLKSNENILMEAAKFTVNEGNVQEENTSDDFAEEQTSENNVPASDMIKNNDEINCMKVNETLIQNSNLELPILSQNENTSNKVDLNGHGSNYDQMSDIINNSERFADSTLSQIENNLNEDIRIDELNTTNTETVINYDSEVEELLDTQIMTCISQRPVKCNLSDTEDSNFIDNILEFKEPGCRSRDVEHYKIQKRQLNKPLAIRHLKDASVLVNKRQKMLLDLEIKLQEELCKSEEKQNRIKNKIESLSVPDYSKPREPSYTRCFFKKFGMPYFEDINGFTPPRNDDHNKKIENGELIITSVPKVHYWIKSEKEIFLEAVKQTLVNENSEKLTKDIYKLIAKLSMLSPDDDSDAIHAMISKNQNKLASLRNMSYLDLVSQEHPDREYDWMKFSASIFNGNHSPEECRRYWNIYLKPAINRDSWKVEEDLKLQNIAEMLHYQDWDAIAELLGTNRTAYQCFVHYQTQLRHENNHSQGKWSKEEDNKLITVINDSKMGDFIPWTKVSSHIGSRTHNQIYNRWSNCLNPKLLKGKFSKEEDLLVVSGIQIFGSNYKELSSLLNNRTCAQIRDRYERHLLVKNSKVGTWSLEEDEKLLNLVAKHGESNWAAIANEMETRNRTQVRQRYGFIQYMTKTNTGWSISQVKRKNIQRISKDIIRTQKKVDRLKKEMEEAENEFTLSKLEKDTFRIEKLRELRDELIQNQYDCKRKKKILSANSEVNHLLIDYFKNCTSCSAKYKTFPDQSYSKDYLNEILLMAKYFEHKLVFPEFEENILKNARLSRHLKQFLCETTASLIEFSNRNNDGEDGATTSNPSLGDNIDYMMPDVDDTILMREWWHTSPIDVTRLNFSEFFKRTVFDYSYGMHKDIWEAKVNRSKIVVNNYQHSGLETSDAQLQHSYATPNAVTLLGLRSIILSRARLRRKAAGKTFVKLHSSNYIKEQQFLKTNVSVDFKLLDKFQETMITLFTWPKGLAVTDIHMTPVLLKETAKATHRPKLCFKRIHPVKNNSNEQSVDNLVVKIPKSSPVVGYTPNSRQKLNFSNQSLTLKRELYNIKNGITYKRKMDMKDLKQSKMKEDHKILTKIKYKYNNRKLKKKNVETSKSISDQSSSTCQFNISKCNEDGNITNEITDGSSKKALLNTSSVQKDNSTEATVQINDNVKCRDIDPCATVSLANSKIINGRTTRSQKRDRELNGEYIPNKIICKRSKLNLKGK